VNAFRLGYLAGTHAAHPEGGWVYWREIRMAPVEYREGFVAGFIDGLAVLVDPGFANVVRRRDEQLTQLAAERRTASPRRRWVNGRLAQLIA
jgi:hypothetical protein